MPFTALEITNFQAHTNLRLELSERVTSIVGPSDVGKSAALRALRWVVLNVPVSSLIRDGAKAAQVAVTVDEQQVRRQRNGVENVYALGSQEYRAFRTDVPASIAALLNVDPLSFQSQHDAVYWFANTSGEVSRQLNAVVNLDIIDRTLAAATSLFNRAKTKAVAAEEALTRASGERDALRWAAEADADCQKVEQAEQTRVTTCAAAEALALRLAAAGAASQAALTARGAAEAAGQVVAAAAQAGRAAAALAGLQQQLAEVRAATVAKDQPVPDLGQLSTRREDVVKTRAQRDALASLLGLAWDRQEALSNYQAAAAKAAAQLEQQTAGRCPLCGQEFKACQDQ